MSKPGPISRCASEVALSLVLGGFSCLFHVGKSVFHLVCAILYIQIMCFCEFETGMAWSVTVLVVYRYALGTAGCLSIRLLNESMLREIRVRVLVLNSRLRA